MEDRECRKCGEVKLLGCFYKHPRSVAGRDTKCKECVKAAAKIHRDNNLDRIRAYDRERGNRQSVGYLQEYRSNNPYKYSAHSMVSNAVRDGKLEKQPCEVCESTTAIHAHHDDYSKPLNVRWLCASHHRQWHIDNGEALNGRVEAV